MITKPCIYWKSDFIFMKVSLYEQFNTYWFQWAHGIASNRLISNIYLDFVLWNLGKLTRGAPEKNKIPPEFLTWLGWLNTQFPPITIITTSLHAWCLYLKMSGCVVTLVFSASSDVMSSSPHRSLCSSLFPHWRSTDHTPHSLMFTLCRCGQTHSPPAA